MLTILQERDIINVWQGPKYDSASPVNKTAHAQS